MGSGSWAGRASRILCLDEDTLSDAQPDNLAPRSLASYRPAGSRIAFVRDDEGHVLFPDRTARVAVVAPAVRNLLGQDLARLGGQSPHANFGILDRRLAARQAGIDAIDRCVRACELLDECRPRLDQRRRHVANVFAVSSDFVSAAS